MSKDDSIYVSLPLDTARAMRKVMLSQAAAAAARAADDPTDQASRKLVSAIYYTVEEIDRKLAAVEEGDA